jgi:Flp pilus assembly protein TadG
MRQVPTCTFPQEQISGLWRDPKGAAAVEFALVASPFILLLLALLQLSIYFMAQFALDSGVAKTAQALRACFTSITPTNCPATLATAFSGSQLKADVVNGSGSMIANSSNTKVEIRPLADLDSAAVPISDGTVDYGDSGSTTSVLVLRAQAQILTFAPGFSALGAVKSSAIVRRQGT